MHDEMIHRLTPYIGRTVTIFTESGGLSGSGFTGVLAGIGDCVIRLITDFGAAPACPIGSSCGYGGYGYGSYGGYGLGSYGGYGYGCGNGCYSGCGGYGYGSCGGYGFGSYGGYGGYGLGSYGGYGGRNWLGSVTEIPIDRIVSFVHNAI